MLNWIHRILLETLNNSQRGPECFEPPVPAYPEKPATLRELLSQKSLNHLNQATRTALSIRRVRQCRYSRR